MGVRIVSLDDTIGILVAGLRAVCNALGDEAANVFLDYYRGLGPRLGAMPGRPQMSPSQYADMLERSIAEVEAMSASVGIGYGDFTEERHAMPEPTDEEFIEWILKNKPGHPNKSELEDRLGKIRAKSAEWDREHQEEYAVAMAGKTVEAY
jgi:hypothetical protein